MTSFHSLHLLKTTRSRQREQDKKTKESEPSESMPTEQITSGTEQCAICMENFTKQEVGIPENCEHAFCLACIIEWAKVKRKIFVFFFFNISFRKIIHVQLIV